MMALQRVPFESLGLEKISNPFTQEAVFTSRPLPLYIRGKWSALILLNIIPTHPQASKVLDCPRIRQKLAR